MSQYIVGLTPARGGSKGIPKKNIKVIAGKPLIKWTIDSAKESKLLDRYVVSTENKEIAGIAKQNGAEILERPLELATDDASTLSVLQHIVKQVACDIVVLLQATSPVRRPGLIDECIKEFVQYGYDSLATGFICKSTEYGKNTLRRQDIKGFFKDDGNIYVIKADILKKGDRYGENIGRKVISQWENLDIDNEVDFWIAGKILIRNQHVIINGGG